MDESLFCSMPYDDNHGDTVLDCAQLGLKELIGRYRDPADLAFVPRYRICYECGDIVASGDDYTRHALAHEVTGIALQLYHFEASEKRRMAKYLRRQQEKERRRVLAVDEQYLRQNIPNEVCVEISDVETHQFDATIQWLRADMLRQAYFHPTHKEHVLSFESDDEEVDVVGSFDDYDKPFSFAITTLMSSKKLSATRRRKRLRRSPASTFNDTSIAEKDYDSGTEWTLSEERRSHGRQQKIKNNNNGKGDGDGKGTTPKLTDDMAFLRPLTRKRHKTSAVELEEKAAVLNLFKQLEHADFDDFAGDGASSGGIASGLFGPLPSQRCRRTTSAAAVKVSPITKTYFTRIRAFSRKSLDPPITPGQMSASDYRRNYVATPNDMHLTFGPLSLKRN